MFVNTKFQAAELSEKLFLAQIQSVQKSIGWLVGCYEDLHGFNNISAISQLGSRR